MNFPETKHLNGSLIVNPRPFIENFYSAKGYITLLVYDAWYFVTEQLKRNNLDIDSDIFCKIYSKCFFSAITLWYIYIILFLVLIFINYWLFCKITISYHMRFIYTFVCQIFDIIFSVFFRHAKKDVLSPYFSMGSQYVCTILHSSSPWALLHRCVRCFLHHFPYVSLLPHSCQQSFTYVTW